MAFSERLKSRPVALVGLMGAGKTSVGRMLAPRLALPFRDSDEAVARAAGLGISGLFEHEGEPAFRALERTALARLLAGERSVIATGGGAVTDPDTRAALRDRAFTIWLDAAPTVLARRLACAGHRPLLDHRDAETMLAHLAEQRRSFYAAADLHITTDELGLDEVVDQILGNLVQPHSAREEPG